MRRRWVYGGLGLALLAGALLAAVLLGGIRLRSGPREGPQGPRAGEPDGGEAAEATRRALRSLPYAAWTPIGRDEADTVGVTVHDRRRAFPGLNLYAAPARRRARLVDMEGRTVHTWTNRAGLHGEWQHVELCRNGDLLVVVKERQLARLDWESNLRWAVDLRAHHEVREAADGTIYALAWVEEAMPALGTWLPVLNDAIAVLSPQGELLRTVPLHQALEPYLQLEPLRALHRWTVEKKVLRKLARRPPGEIFLRENRPADLYHTNTVEILPRDVPGFGSAGDLLIAARNLNLIAVVDPSGPRVVWTWGRDHLALPHHPSLVDDRRLLIFDNGHRGRPWSRVLEVDVESRDVVWEFRGEPPEAFYTGWGGSAQRLPNGNTLIVDTNSGRALEVTGDGDVVWEHFSAVRSRGKDPAAGHFQRASVYRMMRIYDPGDSPELARLLAGGEPGRGE